MHGSLSFCSGDEKPLLVNLHLFEKYKWVNYFLIVLIYIVLFLVAYWLTKLFLRMHKTSTHEESNPLNTEHRVQKSKTGEGWLIEVSLLC